MDYLLRVGLMNDESYFDISQELKKRVDSGMLSFKTKTINGEYYAIACYTKDQFFSGNWDTFSKEHRGSVYRLSDGKRISFPFKKIFNIGETDCSSLERVLGLIDSHEFEVHDKANGHLIIVSYDVSKDNLIVTTKGSFDHEFVDEAKLILAKVGADKIIRRRKLNHTYMFESIIQTDRHALYDSMCEKYSIDQNGLILLGCVDNNTKRGLTHNELQSEAFTLGVPAIARYRNVEEELKSNTASLNRLYEKKGIEGYVLFFPGIDERFKVKTKEYLAMRYIRQFGNLDDLKRKVKNTGISNLIKISDEELHPIYNALAEDMFDWLYEEYQLGGITSAEYNMTPKEIHFSQTLNPLQKRWILSFATKSNLIGDKAARLAFSKSSYDCPKTRRVFKETFGIELYF